MDKGIYCLIFKNLACTVRVGALGEIPFPPGFHCYVGSALGNGGLKRLERHIRLSAKQDKPPKWHVDHIHMSPYFSLVFAIYAVTNERLECHLARELGGGGVPGFGCSDCNCISHIFYRMDDPRDEISAAFRQLNLIPITKAITSAGVQDSM